MVLSLSSFIIPVALISISPAIELIEPPESIPARSREYFSIFKFWALMAILPPLPARTYTSAKLVRDTSACITLLGKLKPKLLSVKLSLTVPCPTNPPNSTRPPKAYNPPPSI